MRRREFLTRTLAGGILIPSGAGLWVAGCDTERPTQVPALVETATAALGPHPDAEAIVLDTVRVLHDGGLVVLG